MGFASFDEQGNRSVMDEQGCNDTVSPSSEVDSGVGSEECDDNSMEDEVNSSSLSSSPNSPFSYSTASPSVKFAAGDSLSDMSSLLQQLPFKRGLSKHFQGKSQSFTCLSNVSCLEDLAKPENPYNKKLKSCKSYAGLSAETQNKSSNDQYKLLPKNASSRQISKKASRGSCSSLINYARRSNNCIGGSLLGGRDRPPIQPPLRSNSTTNFSNQTQTQTPLIVPGWVGSLC